MRHFRTFSRKFYEISNKYLFERSIRLEQFRIRKKKVIAIFGKFKKCYAEKY